MKKTQTNLSAAPATWTVTDCWLLRLSCVGAQIGCGAMMPDDLPHRLTTWAAWLRKWWAADKTAALLEEAAARILTLEKEAENE